MLEFHGYEYSVHKISRRRIKQNSQQLRLLEAVKYPGINLEYHPVLYSALYNREALYNGVEGCQVGIAVGPSAYLYKLTEPPLKKPSLCEP